MVEGIGAIARSVNAGQARAVDLCVQALDRLEAARHLNAVVAIDGARSLREAAAVDELWTTGARPVLAGVPLVVKDLIWVEGRRVTQASRLFADFVAPQDSIAIRRLKDAGAVVVGMANSSEFGCKGVTTNPLHGPTLHPADDRLTPGGSSGGCATAVAAGLVPAGIGTDAGGSSRRPAAHVGCVGFKPSAGAIPGGPGFPALVPALETTCPMTRDVADAALLFRVMAGLADTPQAPAAPLRRLALSPSFGLGGPIDPEVAALLDSAVARLRQAGLTIEAADPAWPQAAEPAALMPLQHAALARVHGAAFRRDSSVFDPDIAVQIEAGLALGQSQIDAARALSDEIRLRLNAFLSGYDAIIGLTAPCFAWPWRDLGPATIDGQAVGPRAHAALTPFANHGGNPAISIPMGVGTAGLPAGLHICARRGEDLALLDLAGRIESVLSVAWQEGGRTEHR
ncbi:amidase [Aureimonas frigidaquae]|uniref:amidase n=1 Tax=Aureimonas frigidaquae TaxID=424757 RepID=UPI000782D238|nr:amidase [Aureimonas frigidaquae]